MRFPGGSRRRVGHEQVISTYRERRSAFRHDALLYAGGAPSSTHDPLSRTALPTVEVVHVVVDGSKIGPTRDAARRARGRGCPSPTWPRRLRTRSHHPRVEGLRRRSPPRAGAPLGRRAGLAGSGPRRARRVRRRHEALLNFAFADAPTFWLACPYDMAGLDRATVRAAERSHPRSWRPARLARTVVRRHRGAEPSARRAAPRASYVNAGAILQRRRPPGAAGVGRVGGSGAWGISFGRRRPRDRRERDRHEQRAARRRSRRSGVWAEGRGISCARVADRGSIVDPLVGRRHPSPEQLGGYGLNGS